MFADIFLIIVFEASETTGMKQNQNNHNFRIIHPVRFITMPVRYVLDHIFFLLDSKFLAKIICHTINLWTL